jgi:alanyl-tRNA synthetase
MIAEGVYPSNTEQGYFVRRLLRRSVRYADTLAIPHGRFKDLATSVIETYEGHYPNLKEHGEQILNAILTEEEQFRKTLQRGLHEFEKLAQEHISGDDAFILFTTYGFPYELTDELAREKGLTVNRNEFDVKMQKHQELSRKGAEQKFKGGLADHSDKVVQYHTVTHLLLAALRALLGEHVHQAGSNITAERLRFDFTHPDKVERETLDKIEDWVNNVIGTGGDVTIETMKKTDAEADSTIEGSFWDKYPDEVNVYVVAGHNGTIFSKELCGGPHVKKLEDIKGTFKITKEESSSRGVRRIKGVLE